jgi:hypothetical protein
MIFKYHENKLFEYDIIISKKIDTLGNMFLSILYLFFDKSKIHFVDNFTIVNINETYIFKTLSHKQNKCIDFLIKKLDDNLIKLNYSMDVKDNLCLIKTTENKIFNSVNKSFSKDYNIFFKQHMFDIIIPENLSITELYYLIKNCKNLILSWGANSYVNSIFVKPHHNLITLCHINYSNEYNGFKHIKNASKKHTQWTPLCNKNMMIYDLPNELLDNAILLLNESLKEININ